MDIVKIQKTVDLSGFKVGKIYYIEDAPEYHIKVLAICDERTPTSVHFIVVHKLDPECPLNTLHLEDVYTPSVDKLIIKEVVPVSSVVSLDAITIDYCLK